MSKIQINKEDLLRIVESTIRAIINENGVNRLINEDLDAVYNNFIEQIAEGRIEVAEEQTMKEAVEKSVANEKLQRKITQLESKIKKEPQFNRQLELKKELKILKEQLV